MDTNERLRGYGEDDDGLRTSYRGECLLRAAHVGVECSGLAGNHIEGKQYLLTIAKDGGVIHWDVYGGKRFALDSMDSETGTLGATKPWNMKSFPARLVGIDSPPCKIQGACKNRVVHACLPSYAGYCGP